MRGVVNIVAVTVVQGELRFRQVVGKPFLLFLEQQAEAQLLLMALSRILLHGLQDHFGIAGPQWESIAMLIRRRWRWSVAPHKKAIREGNVDIVLLLQQEEVDRRKVTGFRFALPDDLADPGQIRDICFFPFQHLGGPLSLAGFHLGLRHLWSRFSPEAFSFCAGVTED